MRFSARCHERQRLLAKSDRVSTTFPCRKLMCASQPCRLKSHGSRRREEPNKHLSVPPPFLSLTSRAKAIEPDLPCLIPRFLCESAHGNPHAIDERLLTKEPFNCEGINPLGRADLFQCIGLGLRKASLGYCFLSLNRSDRRPARPMLKGENRQFVPTPVTWRWCW
jgi:hypothetical protein